MTVTFVLITVQAILGALDNFWHHEITERLPTRRSAATELSLHAARELLYGFIFLGLAWFRWEGAWAAMLATVLVIEVVITLADFVVEDKTRHLPPLERVLHTILALNYGAVIALLVPTLWTWWKLPSQLNPTFHAFSWLFTLFGVGVIAWSVRNTLAVIALRRPPEWVRNAFETTPTSQGRTILISGATGFIGGHLVRRLVKRGDSVIVMTRRPDVAFDRFGPHVRIVSRLDELEASTRVDAIVNLAGAAILGFPWTRARRATLVRSRVETTQALIELMGRLSNPVRTFISASAIGFYGIHADEIIDEEVGPASIFQSQLCQRWEATAQLAAAAGARLVLLRIGLVLGRDGGALPQLARPVRFGLGTLLGSGQQWMSWIHIADLIRLIEFALDQPELRGAMNAVSPTPAPHREFQQELGKALRRPIWLRVPAVFLRTALGEMAQLLVDGQRVVPARATTLGFSFQYGTLAQALGDLLQRTPASGTLAIKPGPRSTGPR